MKWLGVLILGVLGGQKILGCPTVAPPPAANDSMLHLNLEILSIAETDQGITNPMVGR